MINQKGFALVLTLLVSALLVALVVEFITEVYVDTSSRQGYVDGQKASLLADSGLTGGIRLLQITRGDYTSLKDLWAKPIDIPDESGTIRVTIEEENAKINLNLNYLAGPNGTFIPKYKDAANSLFKKLGLPADDLCEALADWLDSDDLPKPGGGESAYYLSRKPAYTARNGQLLTLEELALVKGFDNGVLEKIRPFITVYADPGTGAYININTAPREVLLALDEQMTDSLVDRIIDQRKTTPFKDPGELANVAGMETVAQRITFPLKTKGSIYRLRSEATVNGTTRVVEAVVSFSGSNATKLYWREY